MNDKITIMMMIKITNQFSFLKSIRTTIGTSRSISTNARTTQLTSVSTGGFAWSIKLVLENEWNTFSSINYSYIKIKVMMPKITNGSYLCSHSSKLFNGKSILRHIAKDCFNSPVRFFNSLDVKISHYFCRILKLTSDFK